MKPNISLGFISQEVAQSLQTCPSHMLNCQGSLGALFKGKTFFDLGVYPRKAGLVWAPVCGEPRLAGVAVPKGLSWAQSQPGSFNAAHSRAPSPWNASILFVKLGQLLCCPLRISTSICFWWWVEKTLFHKCSPSLESTWWVPSVHSHGDLGPPN